MYKIITDREEIKNFLENAKTGTYVSFTWRKVVGDFEKVSKGVGRLLGQKGQRIKTSAKGYEYILFATTNNVKHTAHCMYYENGAVIDRAEYQEKTNDIKPIEKWFNKRIDDIVSIKVKVAE